MAVAAAGICAGDLHIYHGRNPYATFPQICGHEIAGVIAESGVAGLDPGQLWSNPFSAAVIVIRVALAKRTVACG